MSFFGGNHGEGASNILVEIGTWWEGEVKNEPRPTGFIFVSALLAERVTFKIETDSRASQVRMTGGPSV